MSQDLKRLSELTEIDELHVLLSQVTGRIVNLEALHDAVASVKLHYGVPDSIRGQFNVARNMALYTYFFYALAPEVQHKTFTVIEMALRERAGGSRKKTLRPLLEEAVASGAIIDAGFRHIAKPEPGNPYSRELPKVLPRLRNSSAHGSTNLNSDTIWYLERCADLVNQLFPVPPAPAPAETAA